MASQRSRPPRQAAVLAVRKDGADVEVCLIRKRSSGAWGIPKGFVDPGYTREETALNEAWEEAGIRGRLIGDPVGTYEYAKFGASLTVAVYVMRVVEELQAWPEMRSRERRWASFNEAASALKGHPVRPFLDHVRARLHS